MKNFCLVFLFSLAACYYSMSEDPLTLMRDAESLQVQGRGRMAWSQVQKAMEISKKNGDVVSEAEALDTMGSLCKAEAHYKSGVGCKYEDAKKYFEQSISLFKKLDKPMFVSRGYFNMGNYYHTSNISEACKMYKESEQYYNMASNKGDKVSFSYNSNFASYKDMIEQFKKDIKC